jgi:predicted double-glycine peptidase
MYYRLLARLVAIAAITAGAPTFARAVEPVKSLLEMRRENVVVQEWELSCGAAALATVLNYQHGDQISERQIAERLIQRQKYLKNPELLREQQGFSLLDLKRFAEQRGYRGVGFGGLAFQDLLDLAPVIVPVRLNGYDHFVVFRGMQNGRVLLADPAWGNRTMPIERFEGAWVERPEVGRVGFVVAAPDGTSPIGQLAPRAYEFVR